MPAKPPPKSRADRAVGFVTCLGCLAWPEVSEFKTRKKADRFWSAYCPNCNDPTNPHTSITGATRDEVKAAWNHRNARWR